MLHYPLEQGYPLSLHPIYTYVTWSMLLGVIEASTFKHEDTVYGMGVSLHVTFAVLTTGGTMILWKCFFLSNEWITYVALGTMSLLARSLYVFENNTFVVFPEYPWSIQQITGSYLIEPRVSLISCSLYLTNIKHGSNATLLLYKCY